MVPQTHLHNLSVNQMQLSWWCERSFRKYSVRFLHTFIRFFNIGIKPINWTDQWYYFEDVISESELMKFWIHASHEYPEFSQIAFKFQHNFTLGDIISLWMWIFATGYLKLKQNMSHDEVEDELWLSLSSITPRLD